MDRQINLYTKPDQIKNSIRKMLRGAYISEGIFEGVGPCSVSDWEWNHMDQSHRILIHKAYYDSIRNATGRDFAISTTLWKRVPIFIQVTDLHIAPGHFYQIISMFGIVYCHQVTQLYAEGEQTRMVVRWYTATYWIFWLLHKPFNFMLARLQKRQMEEDQPIRRRRSELRKMGFKFTTDTPNYINSNRMDDHVVLPAFDSASVDLSNISQMKSERVRLGPISFIVQRNENNFQLWPGLCPHEGAELDETHLCNRGETVSCPWHGLNFKGWSFGQTEQTTFTFLGRLILFDQGILSVVEMESKETHNVNCVISSQDETHPTLN